MTKKAISIRIDSDVLDWFRSESTTPYQSLINQVLRDYRDAQRAKYLIMIGRAQQIFNQYYSRCFWHLKKDLQITEALIPVVQEGLRTHGGREGFRLADELSLEKR